MFFFKTLYRYLFKIYFQYFLLISLLLTSVLLLSNTFDALQKFKALYLQPELFWKLVLYKLPYIFCEVAPLTSFVAMIAFLRRLIRYNELVIMLCSGVYLLRIMFVPIASSFMIGLFIVSTLGPIGAYGLKKYDQLEAKLTKKRHSDLLINQSGIFFFEEYENQNRLIKAKSIRVSSKEIENITILFTENGNNFAERIDADKAELKESLFILHNPRVITKDGVESKNEIILPTNLSITGISQSFVSPDMINIWSLPTVIAKLTKAGIPNSNYQTYFYKQLFKPFMMVATVMLAACFFSINQRDKNQIKKIIISIFCGFIVYAGLEVITRVLISFEVSHILSVAMPIFIVILASNFIILHTKTS